MYQVTGGQYQLVYNGLSFTFATMAASTVFFWLRLGSIHEKYKVHAASLPVSLPVCLVKLTLDGGASHLQSALVITGLVTFIAGACRAVESLAAHCASSHNSNIPPLRTAYK